MNRACQWLSDKLYTMGISMEGDLHALQLKEWEWSCRPVLEKRGAKFALAKEKDCRKKGGICLVVQEEKDQLDRCFGEETIRAAHSHLKPIPNGNPSWIGCCAAAFASLRKNPVIDRWARQDWKEAETAVLLAATSGKIRADQLREFDKATKLLLDKDTLGLEGTVLEKSLEIMLRELPSKEQEIFLKEEVFNHWAKACVKAIKICGVSRLMTCTTAGNLPTFWEAAWQANEITRKWATEDPANYRILREAQDAEWAKQTLKTHAGGKTSHAMSPGEAYEFECALRRLDNTAYLELLKNWADKSDDVLEVRGQIIGILPSSVECRPVGFWAKGDLLQIIRQEQAAPRKTVPTSEYFIWTACQDGPEDFEDEDEESKPNPEPAKPQASTPAEKPEPTEPMTPIPSPETAEEAAEKAAKKKEAKLPLIGGLPATDFINRVARSRSAESHQHWLPCMVLGVEGDWVRIKPNGHRREELVKPEQIHPWWSKNKDLKEKAKRLGQNVDDTVETTPPVIPPLPPHMTGKDPLSILQPVTPREKHRVPNRTPEKIVTHHKPKEQTPQKPVQPTNPTPATPPASAPAAVEPKPQAAPDPKLAESISGPTQLAPAPAPAAAPAANDRSEIDEVLANISGYESELSPKATLEWFEKYAGSLLTLKKAEEAHAKTQAALDKARAEEKEMRDTLRNHGIRFKGTESSTAKTPTGDEPRAGRTASPVRRRISIRQSARDRFKDWFESEPAKKRLAQIAEADGGVEFSFIDICQEMKMRVDAGESFRILMADQGYKCTFTALETTKKGFETVTIQKGFL